MGTAQTVLGITGLILLSPFLFIAAILAAIALGTLFMIFVKLVFIAGGLFCVAGLFIVMISPLWDRYEYEQTSKARSGGTDRRV